MDDEVPRPAEPADEALPEPTLPPPPQGPLADAVITDADELRRLVDAGAGSPEELRALAARIREHRALEESLWRSEVRPELMKGKKRRTSLGDRPDRPERSSAARNLGLAVLGGVLGLLLIATQSSFLWILLPVAAVLVYAYRQGKQVEPATEPGVEPPSEDPRA